MKFYVLVLALVALCCKEVVARPDVIYSRCDREISVGAPIMAGSAVGSTSRHVIISRSGAALPANSAYIPNEALTVTLSSAAGQYIFVTAGATFPGGACSATRSLEISSTLRMPAAGAGPVTVRAAWAQRFGIVTITEDLTLTEAAPT
ncbi:hypothetical protein B484DRAFT_394314, partial [Ochromonadaceae sp. CCMP2298]